MDIFSKGRQSYFYGVCPVAKREFHSQKWNDCSYLLFPEKTNLFLPQSPQWTMPFIYQNTFRTNILQPFRIVLAGFGVYLSLTPSPRGTKLLQKRRREKISNRDALPSFGKKEGSAVGCDI
jgi:hypothetical protein